MKNLIIIIVFVFTIVSCNTNFKPKSNLIIEGKSIGFINLGDKYDLSKKLPTIGCIVDKDSNCVELFTESKTFTTTKGIKIGNKLSEVYDKYGNNPKTLNLNKGNLKIGEISNFLIYENIKFLIDNDTIKKISIY